MLDRRGLLIANSQQGGIKYHWDYTQGMPTDWITTEVTGSSTITIVSNGLELQTFGNWQKAYINLNAEVLELMFAMPFKVKLTFASPLRNYGAGECWALFFGQTHGTFYNSSGGILNKYNANNSTTRITSSFNKSTLTLCGDFANDTSGCEEESWQGAFGWSKKTPARLFFCHGSGACQIIIQSIDIEFEV